MLRSHAMTVGQLARRTGVQIKTLRTYEDLGFLSTPGRSESNYRLFGEEAVRCVQMVQGLRSPSTDPQRDSGSRHVLSEASWRTDQRPAGRIPGADCRPNRGSDGHSAGAASTHPGIPGRQHRRASPPCCLKTGAVVGTRSTSLSVAPCHLPLDALTRRERVHCSQAPQGGEKKPNRARIMCSV